MTLTDLLYGVRRLARPLALGLAVYGCGGESNKPEGCQNDYDCREPRVCVRGYCEDPNKGGDGGGKGFCSAYFEMCPPQNEEDYEIKEGCPKVCNESASPRDQPASACSFLACAVETGYCDNQVEGDPQIIACMQSYGWRCDNSGCEPPQ